MSASLTVEDSPVEMLLKDQGMLQTPVGVFSDRHELAAVEPEQAQFYKQLIPLSKPGEGEQYAFRVDLDKCTGCKACVSACHSLNGLDEDETWRDVGTIHGEAPGLAGASYTQTITTACHHCSDPACLNGCPVLAYEKDPETGIVHHLDDQCIGCQYCALKCPYDVPKYSKKLGIVRKCDMCHSRLAEEEAPACVQACPTEAISITIINTAETMATAAKGEGFLPSAPEPSYTIPTTQYVTERTIPENVEAADYHALRPEHGHFPLVLMLVLTQFSVGLYGFSLFAEALHANYLRVAALICMAIGLTASTLHLGRPLGAWRSFLGLRRSWLSREIVVFGLFSLVAAPFTLSGFIDSFPVPLSKFFGVSTFICGLLGVFTSVMIYHDTRRPFWEFPVTAIKFFGTVLGLASITYAVIGAAFDSAAPVAVFLTLVAFVAKLAMESLMLLSIKDLEMNPNKKTAALMLVTLRSSTASRFGLAVLGLVFTAALLLRPDSWMFAVVALTCLLAAELLERSLFFRAVAAPKMPGGIY